MGLQLACFFKWVCIITVYAIKWPYIKYTLSLTRSILSCTWKKYLHGWLHRDLIVLIRPCNALANTTQVKQCLYFQMKFTHTHTVHNYRIWQVTVIRYLTEVLSLSFSLTHSRSLFNTLCSESFPVSPLALSSSENTDKRGEREKLPARVWAKAFTACNLAL